jgi:rhodanese-related sulfurtransferase
MAGPALPAPPPCAGDVNPAEAWARLAAEARALLVDVRTKLELQLVGGPDLAGLGREPVQAEWMTQQGANPGFVGEVKALLAARGADQDTPLYFLCRTGGRSRMAAGQLTREGYTACYNIVEGYEGDLDAHGHRNSITGWRARGLPWRQS